MWSGNNVGSYLSTDLAPIRFAVSEKTNGYRKEKTGGRRTGTDEQTDDEHQRHGNISTDTVNSGQAQLNIRGVRLVLLRAFICHQFLFWLSCLGSHGVIRR